MPIRLAQMKELIAHAELNDMPDVGGTNTDHDTRYYTEAEVDALLALYLKLTTSNDPLTGELVINPSSGNNALVVQETKRIVFDGA